MLELIVKVININLTASHPIMKRCRPLYEYSSFIQMIRNYINIGKSRDEAIIQAIADCRQEGIMTDFLREHGTEAVNMLFTEFNMEDALDVRYEEGQIDGMQKGMQQGQQFMLKLVSVMLEDGRANDLPRLQNDPVFLKEMMAHYRIITADN